MGILYCSDETCPNCQKTVVPYVESDFPPDKTIGAGITLKADRILCPHCGEIFSPHKRIGGFTQLTQGDPRYMHIMANKGLLLPEQ